MKNQWLQHFFNFFAVILGVILAFTFNERSQEQHQTAEAGLLMQSLSEEIRRDIRTYEQFQVPANREQKENIDSLIALLSGTEHIDDEEQLLSIIRLENYQPSSTIYSSMKTSGKLSLIEDPHLRTALTAYYEASVVESNAKAKFQTDYFSQEILSWLSDNMDFLQGRIIHRENLVVLRNRLLIYAALMEQKIESYVALSEECKTLVALIEARYPTEQETLDKAASAISQRP